MLYILHERGGVGWEGGEGSKMLGNGSPSYVPQGADPLPPSSTCSKAGRNHLNKEITPPLPTGCDQTISNLGYKALLRRCELPL
jgi:hypothetical protein